MRQALVIAAKAPQPGRVKTRLCALLSVEDATELYRCFLKDTLALAEDIPACELILAYTPEGAESYFEGLLSRKPRLMIQRGDSLGDKLHNLFEAVLSEGFDSAVIIGADSPTLPRERLLRAFEEAARPGARAVIGPATDGGYYLIGLERPRRRLFERITWSSERVLSETLERAREIGLEVSLLPEWYDVDDAAGFERLKREIIASERATATGEPEDKRDNRNNAQAASTRRFILSRWPAESVRTAKDES